MSGVDQVSGRSALTPTLAEISDKIALPYHFLILGVLLGCVCCLGTAISAALHRRLGLSCGGQLEPAGLSWRALSP